MRLDLTQRSDLALRALDVVARSGEPHVSGPEIAAKLGISTHYLGSIMTPLTKTGWVRSASGPAGGYRLASVIGDRSILDLIESVEGTVGRDTCMHGDPMRSVDQPCGLHDPWTRARDALLDELAGTKVKDTLGLEC